MSKVLVTRSKLDALVNAYNTLTGESDTLTLDQLATAISEIETGGGDPGEELKMVLENNTTYDLSSDATQIREYSFQSSKIRNASFPNAVKIGSTAFRDCVSLLTATFPSVTEIGSYEFRGCINATSIYAPNATIIGTQAFYQCSNLTSVTLGAFTQIESYVFYGTTRLTSLELRGNITSIASAAFSNSGIKTLIFRNSTSVPTLQNVNAFNSTPIASGTGYIYVPDALVDTWKAATNWSTYAAQIKPLSELPE